MTRRRGGRRLTGCSIAVARVRPIGKGGRLDRGDFLSTSHEGKGLRSRRAGALNGVETMAVDLSMPILVVDDYNTMIRIIRNLLKQLGFEDIDDASDGSAALAKLREKKYGLVISDWNMEPM